MHVSVKLSPMNTVSDEGIMVTVGEVTVKGRALDKCEFIQCTCQADSLCITRSLVGLVTVSVSWRKEEERDTSHWYCVASDNTKGLNVRVAELVTTLLDLLRRIHW